MNSIVKVAGLSIISGVLAISTGCATRSGNSNVVTTPASGHTGNVAYNTGSIVNNSNDIKMAAQQLRSIVFFAFDSSVITPQAAAILDEQAGFLASNPQAIVLIAGHTDERGSREYNQALGERRAQAVRNYLASKGINNARIKTTSYGEERPRQQGATEAAYAENRRAEIAY